MERTANDRFKEGSATIGWSALALAVLVHFALFAFWPDLHAEDVAFGPDELEAIELPPEVEIPPPPENIARPATPVISDVAVDEDITIPSTTLRDNPIENLGPPPTSDDDISQAPVFVPMTVRPSMKNTDEVRRALQRLYPANLRDAGIGGVVNVHFFIDEEGEVRNALVNSSSGYEALDRAALKVAELARFSPALNHDRRVAVWITLDLNFSSR